MQTSAMNDVRSAYSTRSWPVSSVRSRRSTSFIFVVRQKDRGRAEPCPPDRCQRAVVRLARRTGRSIHVGGDLAVPVVQRSAERGGADDRHETDERRQQRVLDEVLPLLVTNEAHEEV